MVIQALLDLKDRWAFEDLLVHREQLARLDIRVSVEILVCLERREHKELQDKLEYEDRKGLQVHPDPAGLPDQQVATEL